MPPRVHAGDAGWASQFAIEKMTEADLDEVMAIEDVSFPRPWTRDVFADELVREWARLDVVRERPSGRVVAFANYWIVADELHLLNIATHPDARRRGHAAGLLRHLVAFGREHDFRCITLEVRRSNEAAQALYRAHAFTSIGVRPSYYENREDAIVMLLEL